MISTPSANPLVRVIGVSSTRSINVFVSFFFSAGTE